MAQLSQPTQLPTAPSATDFTPLSDHQASTPSSFFGAKPVLHAALGLCDLLIASPDTKRWDIFRSLSGGENADEGAAAASGQTTSVAEMQVVRGVSGFVTSSSLILVRAAQPHSSQPEPIQTAISIPYPCISLHATQRLYTSATASQQQPQSYSTEPSSSQARADADDDAAQSTHTQAVYLQLDMDPAARERSNADDGDGDYDDGGTADELTVEILLVPRALAPGHVNGTREPPRDDNGNDAKVREIFEALSRCADLHPDPSLEDAQPGGLAAMLGFGGGSGGMPGAGGWITAENAHEFEGEFGDVDEADEEDEEEETNGLGPGAGRRRTRDDADDDEANGEPVEPGEDDGAGGEETKWQRTG